MQILWKLEKAFVKDIIAQLPKPKPPYNTISSLVRVLEKKGFVGYKAYGKSYERMVSFMVKEENLSEEEIKRLQDIIDQNLKDK